MITRGIIGKRIVAVHHERMPACDLTTHPPWTRVSSVELENGVHLVPHATEYGGDPEEGATMVRVDHRKGGSR